MSTDEELIQSGIEAARTETRAVDDATARAIAAQLHGGQNTALYSLVSTGNLQDERLAAELRELSRDPDPQVRDWADALNAYTQHHEERGPVEGWSRLWPSQAAAGTRSIGSTEGQSMTSNLTRGSRVRDRIWGGTESGTVTGVDEDGTVTIQWDGAQFTEDQRTLDEIEPIDGTGDPTARYMVMYDGGRYEPVNIDDDTDSV